MLRTEVRSSVWHRKHFIYLSYLLAQDFSLKRLVALQKELQATGTSWEWEKQSSPEKSKLIGYLVPNGQP